MPRLNVRWQLQYPLNCRSAERFRLRRFALCLMVHRGFVDGYQWLDGVIERLAGVRERHLLEFEGIRIAGFGHDVLLFLPARQCTPDRGPPAARPILRS